jgi:hypothetical protein
VVILAAAATFAVMRVEPLKHFFWKSRATTVAPASSARATSTPKAAPNPATGRRPAQTAHERARQASTSRCERVADIRVASRRDADYYLVVFSRGGNKIFRARPSSSRLVLPAHWTFHGTHYGLVPGHYSWVVRPGYGPRGRGRYGPATVRAKLVIQRGSVG